MRHRVHDCVIHITPPVQVRPLDFAEHLQRLMVPRFCGEGFRPALRAAPEVHPQSLVEPQHVRGAGAQLRGVCLERFVGAGGRGLVQKQEGAADVLQDYTATMATADNSKR